MRCPDCPVPVDVACFSEQHGLEDWCRSPDFRRVALGRSLGLIAESPSPDAERLQRQARACPHGDPPQTGCGCEDRLCRRFSKIMSGLDCLLCVAHKEEP